MMKAEEIINILKKINYWSVELSLKGGATPYRWGKVERGKIGISPFQLIFGGKNMNLEQKSKIIQE